MMSHGPRQVKPASYWSKGDSVISSYMDKDDNNNAFYKGWLKNRRFGIYG